MRAHRLRHQRRRPRPLARQAAGVDEAGPCRRQSAQGQGPVRQAAAVDAGRGVERLAAHRRQRCAAAALHRVAGVGVAPDRLVQVHGRRQHTGVLARTVVVRPRRPRPGADQFVGGGAIQRRVRTAGEVVGAQAQPRQPRRRPLDVSLLAVVRRAGERHVLGRDPEGVGGPGLDQRQRLDRLHRRAREDEAVVRPARDDGTPGVGDDDPHAVPALDPLAAINLDAARQENRRHRTRPRWWRARLGKGSANGKPRPPEPFDAAGRRP